ncbi:Gfo/Idh/MocA family oxidoreductase [Solwaraspora sp. WMMD792]|uniref:Gfo/Idh/MocA family protein n=1 Tax=Solwaraspora sp. WMMD792 TaxID=3016099 RepID=UPI00241651C1|nr:Gfo/Idh/MocA family oxidoreductase [Solwaraspora sp. WMMD792]MDG4773858.1 Gfo/Idh/MocA family oxidoreductase [Solwaraspora sp. WMMD792]
MVERVGVAIVGGGFMGGVHADVLAADPRAELRWVVDRDERVAADLAARTSARVSTSLDDALLDDAVRLVVVATPAATHQPIAAQAISAGRHVLVEKPLVLSPGHARELAAEARSHGVTLAHGGNFGYAPKFVRAHELAADRDALGTVHSVRVVFRTSGPDADWFRSKATAGGGALTDLGWHAVELCRWMLGKPAIRSITACTRQLSATGDVEDQGIVLIEFADGAIGQCDVSWVCPGGEQLTVEVIGTEGLVRADFWQGMGVEAYTNTKFGAVWEPNQGWLRPEWEWIRNSGYVHQDRQVLDAILAGRPMTHTPDDAIAVVEALDAAYRSAEDGRKVELND